MTIFKCKMCGGTLEFNPGDTVAVCDSCGTKQTLPKLDDDRRANLYDRANHFRRSNEYDKAMGIYEQILAEDNTDAEAYWSLVLCRYGIEYVEDPATHKRVPTVNRAQFTSIFDDDNYKSALHYADAAQREVYESEAKAINEIQKGILAISQKEQPFDVFICYKETDAGGRRTPDSVLANDLYHQLTQEGFKVFFARITLEDKLGTAYEPYIFAALNSAKVMVVLGTKPEYFNAVWVKNEWSRYLALVKNSGGKKMLIPAYKDMDPYDLPEEFSHLQAQDMGKLGFMQDLIRGIKKIISADAPKAAVKETVVVSGGNAAVEPLLKRAFMFLEDGNWQEADTYCEKVLDQDPENARAYLGKLMAQLHIATKEELPNCATELTQNDNYQKALRFADDALHTMLTEANEQICRRNAKAVYDRAAEIAKNATSMAEFQNAAKMFASIEQFEDAAEKREECQQSAEKCRLAIVEAGKERAYNVAMEHMRWNRYAEALRRLEEITGWKDADEQAAICKKKIAEQKEVWKKKIKILIPILAAVVILIILFVKLALPKIERNSAMNKAMTLIESGDYDAGYAILEELGEDEAIQSNKYDRAIKLLDSGDYDSAYVLLKEIGKNDMIESNRYDRAIELIGSGDYQAAYALMSGLKYKDSREKLWSIEQILLARANIGDTVRFGFYEQDNDISNGQENIEWLVLAKQDNKILVISDKALDCKPYNNEKYTKVTWETCALRKWLNSSFINSAFSSEEKAKIPTVTVSADKNPKYSTDPGNATQDQVFLLSIAEAEKYFSSNSARRCTPTEYAIANGAERSCLWWLRSPGKYSEHAADVQSGGDIYYAGYLYRTISAYDGDLAVRPAMWISLE